MEKYKKKELQASKSLNFDEWFELFENLLQA